MKISVLSFMSTNVWYLNGYLGYCFQKKLCWTCIALIIWHTLQVSWSLITVIYRTQHQYQLLWFWPWVEYPSCRHTTVASVLLQPSSHTVPHTLFIQISTLPSFGTLPPTSRSWPVVHGTAMELQSWLLVTFIYYPNILWFRKYYVPSHPTPASAEWEQLCLKIGLL